MPEMIEDDRCVECHNIRELTDCDRWFCDRHTSRKDSYSTTPMTVWSGGRFAIDKAA